LGHDDISEEYRHDIVTYDDIPSCDQKPSCIPSCDESSKSLEKQAIERTHDGYDGDDDICATLPKTDDLEVIEL